MSSTVGERSSEVRPDGPPHWASVPDPSRPRPPAPKAHARRLALGGALALILWLLGHHVLAVIVVGAVVLLTVVSVLRPSAGERIQRVEGLVERGAGRVLAALVMGALMLLVITPIWLVLRVVRHNPLALGRGGPSSTLWRPHVSWSRGSLYRRPFAYERTPREAGAAPGRAARVCIGLGLLLVIAAVDVGLGAVLDRLRDDAPPENAAVLSGRAVGSATRSSRAVVADVTRAFQAERYDPYLGWRVADFTSRNANVREGIRRSYRPAAPQARDPITVFFFGGSAMFGAFQRDDHTIASNVAREAERDGISLRVLNYGQPAYVLRQEVTLLESLVARRRRPDLAVFFDGFNELMIQFALGPHRVPTHLAARITRDRLRRGAKTEDVSFGTALYRAWADTSAVHRAGRALGIFGERGEQGEPITPAWTGDQGDRPGRRAINAVSLYSQTVDLARRLAGTYGFRSAFFWQPSIYTKRVLSEEEPLTRTLGADADAWRRATRVARSRLPGHVVDLGESLDQVKEPIMYDFVHTNEVGARAVARAMYARLEPTLRELARERSR